MKCIIAGSRRIPNLNLNDYDDWHIPERRAIIYNILEEVIKESGFLIDFVLTGKAWGMDYLGEQWARNNNIPVIAYPAEWSKWGKAAGPKRNVEMSKAGDCLICIHSKGSTGSEHMIKSMKEINKPLIVRTI